MSRRFNSYFVIHEVFVSHDLIGGQGEVGPEVGGVLQLQDPVAVLEIIQNTFCVSDASQNCDAGQQN